MNTTIRLLLLSLLWGATAQGAAPGDPARCVGIDDDTERLSCYDAALGRQRQATPVSKAASKPTAPVATTAPVAKATTAAAAPAASATAAAVTAAKASSAGKESTFGLNSKQRLEQQGTPEEAKEITAKVTKVQRSPEGYFTVWLDNGQAWRQSEVVKDLAFASGDSVTIRRTFSGGYLLRNDSGSRAGYARRLE